MRRLNAASWIALVLACVAVWPAEGHEGSDLLHLRDTAVVQKKYVRLLDLVRRDTLSGDTIRDLRDIYLGRAPQGDESRVITLGQIEDELVLRGIPAGRFRFGGEKVVVTRGHAGETLDRIEDKLVRFIETILTEGGTVPVAVHVVDLSANGPKLTEATEYLEARHLSASSRGVVSSGVRYRNPDGQEGLAEVLVNIADVIWVAAAARDLPAGKLLYAEDIQLKKLESSSDHPYLTREDLVVGSRTAKPVKKDALFTRELLRLRPIVRKRQIVRAVSDILETEAQALGDGTVGDIIELEYTGTKNRFKGRIVDAKRVEIVQ